MTEPDSTQADSGVGDKTPGAGGETPALSVSTVSIKRSELTHLTRDELGLFVTAMIILNEAKSTS